MLEADLPFEIKDERPLRYIFLDLNSYFASVEQQEDPSCRNKPVGVVPVNSNGSVLVAASYEAKAYGIRTGTRVWDAKQMCPDIILKTPDFHTYSYYHHRVLEATEQIIPIDKVCSVDEFQIELLGRERVRETALELAQKIKSKIQSQVGECITSSIGIAPNPFLAKIGTEIEKPNGLVVIEKDEIEEKLSALKLTDLPGINHRMKLRLYARGILTVSALLQASRTELLTAFGSIIGERWWYMLRGYMIPIPRGGRKSLGHSHVLPPEHRNEAGAKQVMMRLIQKAASRMHSEKLWAKGMAIRVSGYHRSWGDKMKLSATQDFNKFIEYFLEMWKKRDFLSPRKVSVTFYHFVKQDEVTPSLFDPQVDRVKFNRAVDDINLKFGKQTIYLAGMQKAKNTGKEKLAFEKTTLFYEGKEGEKKPGKELKEEKKSL